MKKTVVDLSDNKITVSVHEEGGAILTRTVPPEAVEEMVADLKVTPEVAVKFLTVYIGADLRNPDDPEKGQAEFISLYMEGIKNGEKWATDCVTLFSTTMLPLAQEIVKTATAKGQDPATAVSLGLGMEMEGGTAFAACVKAMEEGLTGEQINSIIVGAIRGDAPEVIARNAGISEELLKKP